MWSHWQPVELRARTRVARATGFGILAASLLLGACGDDDGGTTDSRPTATVEVLGATETATTATEATTAAATSVATEAPTATAEGTYVVQPGDTLGGIATLLGVTLEDLIAANSITDPNLIVPGQELVVP